MGGDDGSQVSTTTPPSSPSDTNIADCDVATRRRMTSSLLFPTLRRDPRHESHPASANNDPPPPNDVQKPQTTPTAHDDTHHPRKSPTNHDSAPTLAERKFQRKSQQGSSSNGLHVRKAHLFKWDLNMPATSAQPSQSSTTVAYGIPTPQTPLSLPDMDVTMETEAHMDRGGYAAWDNLFRHNYTPRHISLYLYVVRTPPGPAP